MTIAKGAALPDGYRGRYTDGLLLERLYHWEQTSPDRVCFTQPLGQGRVRELTFREAVGEVRRIAAHLQSLNLPRGTSIGLVGRNSVHWMLADLEEQEEEPGKPRAWPVDGGRQWVVGEEDQRGVRQPVRLADRG